MLIFLQSDYVSDHSFAAFLGELSSQSLQSLNYSFSSSIGPDVFQDLSRHGKSLVNLKLHGLLRDVTLRLSLLNGCTNLVSLSLAEGLVETLNNDTPRARFREIVAWLEKCKNLQIFACTHIPFLVELVVSSKSIHLTSLEYNGSVMWETHLIHERLYVALANQKSLQCLRLDREGPGQYVRAALNVDTLVDSLSRLVNLKDLRLENLSKYFIDKHVVQLATSLPKLEVWFITGRDFTDRIWPKVASLGSLRQLKLDAGWISTRGILDFIKKLGPGNKGLVLSMRHGSDNKLWCLHRGLIEEKIAEKVKGRYIAVAK